MTSIAGAQRPVEGPIVEKGEINGARFRIDIPENWHGGLVLWAHGYRPPGAGYPLPGDEAGERSNAFNLRRIEILGELGYAMAQSAFSVQGFAVREGALDTEALRRHFVRTYGPTYPTIIAGSHLGGLITYDLIERFPESYDGALAMSGTGMPKLELCKQRMFDLRLLFDYYFPEGLPGSVVDFPEGVGFLKFREIAARVVAENPERAEQLLRMFRLQDTQELVYCVALYSSILQDLYLNRAGGNAFDNTNTVYSGSDDDGRLNREIPRYTSDPRAVEYLRRWTTPTCRISDPVLALNPLGDPIVPIHSTPYYAQACERAGATHLFVQMWMDQASPVADQEKFRYAFQALTRWIKDGVRPEPGDIAMQLEGDGR
jgi:hypothetical protein